MSETPVPVAAVRPLREAVAEEVRAALGRRRMSASALARALRKSQTYVWRRLSGETAFDTDDLEAIAAILGVAVVDLLPRDGRSGSHVTAGYREQAESTVPFGPNVVTLLGDGSAAQPDPHRRPRRLVKPLPPMPIMPNVAA